MADNTSIEERCPGTCCEGGFALGRHMTVEFYDCDPKALADAELVKTVFLRAAEKSGATVIDANFHEFEPQGVSGVVVISESHFAVHAWPEHDYAAVDLFTCGDKVDFEVAIDVIAKGIKSAQWIVSSVMNRGIVGNNGVERLVPVIEGRNCRFSLSWEERFLSSRAHALSASIDIYECRAPWIGSSEALRKFALDFAEKLGLEPRGEWRVNPSEAGFFAWVLPLKDGGLSGRIDLARKAAYLDLFVAGFFDPRKAAEFATFELGGNYYRMQPHVRQ
ncbi:adenosylmethionine decarboxylase [Victivallaceae bacterium BBE-744-WT-12]|uniref:S-adenosylmethionine decarboxylase proenzyme n=1 Tax=Victivallis lenta TaxID=2606640 RepID=A0A844G616_9BACT|nr:adenosylmethionine decarboxylase [Victivallis lenta]AVM44970.1 adenosylmethionine decarboxylase [Victivallales bacterium CCUG 44730]MBS1452040.1 adenosylmethionine decarboxylase [Lentisphaeria bacterium]MBS5529322.1 adenosylmethionine decarboxylase [bacterium]MST97779.1 adenosylmethionine decarboxylase [Victivallis lenta]HBP07500.1 adenosylmethionine decarboxylase [Lentisphaeria bacterium]